MQVAPQNSSSISQYTLVELFSRFLSRLLEKEDKYPVFLKEWESFKSLLTKSVPDLDAAFIHLATMQANMQRVASSLPQVNILNTKTERTSSPPKKPFVERRPRPSFTVDPNSHMSYMESFSMLAEEHEKSSTSIHSHALLGVAATTLDDLAFTHSPVKKDYGSFKFPEAESAKKPYPLSFLTQKAKEMKEHVSSHSHTLEDAFAKGTNKDHAVEVAQRTPLRRIVVYSARQNYESSQPDQHQQNDIYSALQNLAGKLEDNYTKYPFNNALITHY